VKRHVLTHRHTDLKDEFYARVRAQGQVPDSERKLRDELKKTKERLAELVEENKRQQAEIEMFARVVNVLTVENDQLRGRPGRKRTPLVALRPAPEPGS
jgi:predicted nuclease with TOPRIM domain